MMKQKVREQSYDIQTTFRSAFLIGLLATLLLVVGGFAVPLSSTAGGPGSNASDASAQAPSAAWSPTGPSPVYSLCVFFVIFSVANGLMVYSLGQVGTSRPATAASPMLVRSSFGVSNPILFPWVFGGAMTLNAASALFQMGMFMYWLSAAVQVVIYCYKVYSWWKVIVGSSH